MKKYRLTIIALLLSNCAFAGLFFYHSNFFYHSEEAYVNPYPLIDVSRNFVPQEDFIVNLQPLREKLRPIYAEYGEDKISLYIEFLNTGGNISYNEIARYYPASLIKSPVAIAAVKKIEKGEWNWDSELVLFSGDIQEQYGNLYREPIGTRFTIEKLLEEMLVNSDNTAYFILLRNLGAGALNDYLTEVGMTDLFDGNSNITAKEYTRLFRALYTSSYLERENSQKILEFLARAGKDRFLDKALPEDVIFAHKIGENDKQIIYADSGIVYIPNRPYVITVLFKGDGNDRKEKIEEFFEKVSRTTYEYFKNQ